MGEGIWLKDQCWSPQGQLWSEYQIDSSDHRVPNWHCYHAIAWVKVSGWKISAGLHKDSFDHRVLLLSHISRDATRKTLPWAMVNHHRYIFVYKGKSLAMRNIQCAWAKLSLAHNLKRKQLSTNYHLHGVLCRNLLLHSVELFHLLVQLTGQILDNLVACLSIQPSAIITSHEKKIGHRDCSQWAHGELTVTKIVTASRDCAVTWAMIELWPSRDWAVIELWPSCDWAVTSPWLSCDLA